MAILVRTGTENWAQAEPVTFANESELQELLYRSPDLIERPDDGPLVFAKEALLPGSHYVDLLGVASNGDILLVETKLAKNPEIRRKVIGQIFEYAAFLWNMSYSDLDDLFQKQRGKSLFDLLSERTTGLVASEFESTVSSNLASGSFHLLIAVDEMTKDLEKIIAYVSSRGDAVKLEALEVRVYTRGPVHVLVPQRYGQLVQPSVKLPTAHQKLTIAEVIANAKNEHVRELMELISQRWQGFGNIVDAGTASLSCKALVDGSVITFFYADPSDVYALQPNLAVLEQKGAPPALIGPLRSDLSRLKGFPIANWQTVKCPVVHFAGLDIPTIETFLDKMNFVVHGWRSHVEESDSLPADNFTRVVR